MTAAESQPGRATTAALPGGRRLNIVIALLVSLPSLACLLWLGGIPGSWPGWTALIGPPAGAAAVLACRRDLRLAVLLLTVALVCVPASDAVYQLAASPWVEFVSLSPIAAAAAVYCALGADMSLLPSLAWLAGSTAISWWSLGGDAAYLLLGAGWWAIGRVLRSRQAVAENLHIRAAELDAERDRFTAEAIRQERSTIARELHDVVAHCMTVIVIQSRAGQHLLGRDRVAAEEAMEVIVAVAAEAEADIASLVALMDPERPRRLTQDLLAELVSRSARTGAIITVEIGVDPDDLPNDVAVAAHRLVQEAITNAFRHAPGATITVDLGGSGPLVLEVTNGAAPAGLPDPGAADEDAADDDAAEKHPPLGRSGTGRGLLGLRERIEGVGGGVRWGPTSSGGWQVAATFPTTPATQ